jgi:coproporphyrinogen III oxidase-like Fe-S oxidoreductase
LRTEKPRMPRDYMAQAAAGRVSGRRRVDPAQLPFEFALNAFRLLEGSTQGAFESATGLPATVLQPTLEGLAARGLIEQSADRMRATALGLRFLNDVQAAFLPGRPGRPA